MGREATVTAEQVNAMADTISAQGGKPTSRAIRERLGNTGSMGTINKFLQAWRATHVRQQPSALALPGALQNAILDFIGHELTTARAALETELAEQQQEASDLATENERQLEMIDTLNTELANIAAQKASAEGKAQQLATDLALAQQEASHERQSAEHARTELAKAQLRLEAMPRLLADLETLRMQLQTEQQGRIEAERAAAVLQAQKDDLQNRVGMADGDVTRLREELLEQGRAHKEEMAERLNHARTEANRLIEQVAQMQNRLDAMSLELSKALSEAKKAAEEAAEMRGKLAMTEEKTAKQGKAY